ncbi:MAG: endolytic transglycosylase MltG [Lachnospiraceae bacterium]|nr:endolytic transglycosylase MltG [Lachnospiraceae bacterium]
MKLKYYLRGFGTGVLFATVVLMIALGINKSFGSGGNSASSGNLPETTVGNAEESSGNQEMTSQDQSSSEESETVLDEVTSEDMTSDVGGVSTEDSTSDFTGNMEETTTDVLSEPNTTTVEPDTIPQPEPDTTADSGDRETVTFVISSGMISNTAANILEELGVVESGYDFNMYLYNNGYESKLRVGTYEIPKGASYEEITRIITGGR